MTHDETEWNITLVDTGQNSNTGERLQIVEKFISSENFFFTYGDGLSDQNLLGTLSTHLKFRRLVTLTAVAPPARYGALTIETGLVKKFVEKTSSTSSLVNGCFFVVNKSIFQQLRDIKNPSWEIDVLPALAQQGELAAFEHLGFWYAMDTQRDKDYLESMLSRGNVPWLR